MHLKLLADASGLVSATKAGERALDALGGEAKDAGKALGTTGREARTTERQVDELGKEAKTTGRELDDMGREARGAGQDLEGMSRQAEQASRAATHLGKASHSLRGGGKALAWGSEKIVNQYTALAGGLGIAAAAVQSAKLDKNLTNIKLTAGATSEDAKQLREDLFRMSGETGAGIESLAEGFNSLVQSGETWGAARQEIDAINIAMAVSGASAEQLAGGLSVASKAFNFNLATPGLALSLLDKMTVAGRQGSAELKDLSSIFARVGVGASAAGFSFDQTLGFVEALSNMEKNPERLATLADSTIRLFNNMNYLKNATKATGVRFFDPSGSRRDVQQIFADLRGQYRKLSTDEQRAKWMQKAFGQADLDTQRGIGIMLKEGSLEQFSKNMTAISGSGGALKKDLAESTNNLIDQAGRLKTKLLELGDKALTSPIKHLTSVIQHFNDMGPLAEVLIRKLALGLGSMFAVVGTMKAIKLVQEFKEVAGLGRRPVGPSGLAAAIEGAGVQKVFVTNFPGLPRIGSGASTPGGLVDRFGNPISSSPGVPSSTIPTASAPGAWASWGRTAAIGTGIAGVGAAMGFMESGNTPEGWGRALGGAAGVALGAFGGPIGMMIGQQMGDTVGLILGGMVGDLMKEVEAQRKEKYKADREDITGHKVRKAFGEQMRVSDVTSSDRGGLEIAQRSSARAKALASGVLGNVVTDPKQTIQVNVETHVAADGTSQVKVSGDKAEVSTGFFKSYEKKMGSLTPQWALGR